MITAAISAFFLCVILFLVARHEADYSLPKVIIISLGLTLVNMVFSIAAGLWVFPVVLFTTAWCVQKFCYLEWGKASIVSALYVLCMLGYHVGFAMISQ